MNIDTNAILALPAAEKLRLVEMLWDGLGGDDAPIPLPEWVDREATRRRDELAADPSLGATHTEVWSRIAQRDG